MTIDNYKFAGKKAIVRVDFNVPLDENGNITDDTRIRGALPTLKKILEEGGSLIIMSHMGKPKGKVNPKFSLAQIKDAVGAALGREVKFADDCAKAADAAAPDHREMRRTCRQACGTGRQQYRRRSRLLLAVYHRGSARGNTAGGNG